MARVTCKTFAHCRQNQKFTNGFLRQGDGAIYEKLWCSKCGRQWYHVYVHYMVIDADTGEVISKSDQMKFHQDIERIVEDLKTGDPEKLEIPH